MPEFPNHAQLANISLIEELYARYQLNPESVDQSWRHFFEGIDFGSFLYQRGEKKGIDIKDGKIRDLIQAYRRWGHLLARFNPLQTTFDLPRELKLENLGFLESDRDQLFPTLGFSDQPEALLSQWIETLQSIYSHRIGFEYMDLGRLDLEKWVQQRIEPKLQIELAIEEKRRLLEDLNKSEAFETFLHTKYVGQTRFSLEGAETIIPLLAQLIDRGANLGAEEFLIGMAHRGRLNILTNILNKPFSAIFEEFEDDTLFSFSGNDDVRYHMGFQGQMQTRSGKKVFVEMAANPSHLESVDPVVLGLTLARQIEQKDEQKTRIVPLLIHGDASVAGQGVVYETLQFMNLPSYSVGGTIHLVINNQIGYTTLPEESRSTRYCTDIAKAFGCPVFHVNAEDPESCLFVAQLAIEIRQTFHCDVFIDLLCYRKYGHNEGDEPSFTQPIQYQMIRSKKTIRQLYLEQLLSSGHLEQKMAELLDLQFKQQLQTELASAQEKIKGKTASFSTSASTLLQPVPTAVEEQRLASLLQTFCTVPASFHLHPKLQKWVQDRLSSLQRSLDWSTAECMAFASLLDESIPIRLAGEDCQRGTFSQRHAVWIDAETGQPYSPLNQYKTRCDIVNSPLTEFAGMGFEYGYSWGVKQALILWEAQYGDFNNGAQTIIDQYLVSAEQKWNTPSSLILLLPHGYEGAGPEHSSARLERFLQLAALDNIQVVNATTPAQYFHLLRRQALRKQKRPLIVFTPKSLLRFSACSSRLEEFTTGNFQEILDDPSSIASPKRILFCSGKIFYDLLAYRKRSDTVLVRIEQLYPLHLERLKKIVAPYKGATEWIWVQEEPKNMGAWNYISPHLQTLTTSKIHYVGRLENPNTATGSNRKHKQEQQALIEQAFGEL